MAEIIRFPTQLAPDNRTVAAKLRGMAEEIEEGRWGDVDSLCVLVEEGGRMQKAVFARNPMDRARYAGLLAFAMARATE